MKKYFTICSLIAISIFGLTSCDIINPEEAIPAYLHIEPFQVTASVGEGSNSSNITDAFVFVDNSFIGAYTLPATVPVLLEGQQRVDLFPGIKDNGIDATPEIYPFYTSVREDKDLVPAEIDSIFPVVSYVDDLKFTIVENFESTLQLFRDDIDGDDSTRIELTDTEVFEGQKSAKIVLSKEHPIIQVASIRLSELPLASQGVYLELNYKTEVPFEVGLYYYDTFNARSFDFRHGVNVKTEWNKVYINMTPEFIDLSGFTDLAEFQIGIRAATAIDDDGNFIDGNRSIFLDNLKLIHF